MKTLVKNKKIWVKPEVKTLSVKKDTAAGMGAGVESGGDNRRPKTAS